ncbi:MAG: nucleotidyltransferase [Cyanobacteria bacterium PR.023]|nr:nucleotidyltransferase [Cyanobacteria bacterium PR.023]
MNFPASVKNATQTHSYPLVFATACGAHLTGLDSPTSPYEIRGAHILPVRQVLGLEINEETVELRQEAEGIQIDIATQDIKKFFSLMPKDNGFVLEQIYSPLVVQTSPEHEELKAIAKGCLTRIHCYHYLGFADSQWLAASQEAGDAQELMSLTKLLSVYRLLLTGTHLMQTGEIETNLAKLNENFLLKYIDDMIERNRKAENSQTLEADEWEFHKVEYERLRDVLEDSADSTDLPAAATAHNALDDLLKRIRMADTSFATQLQFTS